MQRTSITVWSVALCLLAVSGSLSAHHSTGVFDITNPIRVKGTVVRFHWGNPHSAIIVEAVGANGEMIYWALENSSRLDVMESRGFTKDSFKPGDHIEACGYAPKPQNAPHLPVSSSDSASNAPHWLEGAEHVITARLLVTKDGPNTEWSHYGPLELCMSKQELEAHSR